jgi:hypothetical protein
MRYISKGCHFQNRGRENLISHMLFCCLLLFQRNKIIFGRRDLHANNLLHRLVGLDKCVSILADAKTHEWVLHLVSTPKDNLIRSKHIVETKMEVLQPVINILLA